MTIESKNGHSERACVPPAAAAGAARTITSGCAVLIVCAAMLCAVGQAQNDALRVPDRITANTATSIATSGSGEATFYLFGPVTTLKRTVKLGSEIALAADELRDAGRYTAVIKGSGADVSRSFFVLPAAPAAINFLARPSRVPTSTPKVISGVAFLLDDYKNLATEPANVNFSLSVDGSAAAGRAVPARLGIAWASLDSAKKAGNAEFVAAVGGASVRRVVQQVAAEPCNLSFKAQPSKHGILVETAPVHDCSGNPVPDGTIVTFISMEGQTRSTIDARVKRGIARAELPAARSATISAASGVVLGNEVHWGGGQ